MSENPSIEDITIIIKTIHRPWSCNRLVKSIQQYASTAKIHVLDDGKPELRFSVEHPETAASIDLLIETNEFDIGISAGRNRLLASVTTPYFIMLDDDHVLTEATKMTDMFARFRQLEDRLDLLAFGDTSVPRCFSMHESTRTMYTENHAHAVDDDVQWCDLVTNAFLAITEPARFTRWDEQLKLHEHWDYFLRAARNGMRVALSTAYGVDHRHVDNVNYRPIRYRSRYRSIVLKKHKLRAFQWRSSPRNLPTKLLFGGCE